jgi:hypothetical protein
MTKPPGPSTLALVESATQLLNVAEWAHARGEADGLRVAVLAPRHEHTVRQIARVAEQVAGLGLDVRNYPVRTRGLGVLSAGLRVMREMTRAQRLVVGDPFSRFIQTLLPLAQADDVVIVDDGTATWEFARCIDAAKPLVRWGVPLSGPETRAARAGRLLSPSVTRELTVFSCLAEATPTGATGIVNRYGWTKSWRRPIVVDDEIDVLGVSLVDSGLVDRRAYLDAVAVLAQRHAPVRYIAHRRESESLVAEIATLPGVRVLRADLPVELALRQGPVARHVITFPSTAAHTLPVVLRDVGVTVEVRRIEPAWFTPSTTSHAREFVARIAEVAPPRPLLEIV